MQDAAVLYAGSCPYLYAVHIAAYGDLWPHRGILSQAYVTDHNGAGVHQHPRAYIGFFAAKAAYIGCLMVLHVGFTLRWMRLIQ